jgi:hypothetical protein
MTDCLHQKDKQQHQQLLLLLLLRHPPATAANTAQLTDTHCAAHAYIPYHQDATFPEKTKSQDATSADRTEAQ